MVIKLYCSPYLHAKLSPTPSLMFKFRYVPTDSVDLKYSISIGKNLNRLIIHIIPMYIARFYVFYYVIAHTYNFAVVHALLLY